MHRRAQAGFTLIEIMVVVVLIGIVTTLAVINIGTGDDRPEREARRLAAVLDAAADQAIIQARELGLRLDEGGYTVVRLEGDDWDAAAFQHDRMLAPHTLPDDLSLEISADDLPGERNPGDGDTTPHVLILSSGELTPFRMEIRRPGARTPGWLVTGDLDGSIGYHEDGNGS